MYQTTLSSKERQLAQRINQCGTINGMREILREHFFNHVLNNIDDNQEIVYFTLYTGNKLPPKYIGSSYLEKITETEYNGSVSSTEYKRIWESERRTNRSAFETWPIICCNNKKERYRMEHAFQLQCDAINRSDYINKEYALRSYRARSYDGNTRRFVPRTVPIHSSTRDLESRIDGLEKDLDNLMGEFEELMVSEQSKPKADAITSRHQWSSQHAQNSRNGGWARSNRNRNPRLANIVEVKEPEPIESFWGDVAFDVAVGIMDLIR